MSEDRITALEEMVAHQAKTLDELSEQLTEQWKVIDRMKRSMERMGEQLDGMASVDAPVGAKPPHY
ncbi:MAG: SlyX family protein [Asticcacaulis sp.]